MPPYPRLSPCYYGLAQIVPILGYPTRTIMGRGVLVRGGPRRATLKWAITHPSVGHLRRPKV